MNGVTTYRVKTVSATLRSAPHGQQLRRLAQGETFQGQPSTRGWVARVDGAGVITGYIRSQLVERFDVGDMPRHVRTGPNGLGDAVSRLAGLVASGGSQTDIAVALGDYAAEVTGRTTEQSASVVAGLMRRIETLEQAIEELRMTRTVGG